MDYLTLKGHNYFQNHHDRKTTHGFAPRPLIFKLQQEVLKSKYICKSCSFPKTVLETHFLDLENQSFENVSFSQ